MRHTPRLLLFSKLLLLLTLYTKTYATEVSDVSTSETTLKGEHCGSNSKLLGVFRTLEIDTKGGPIIGKHKNKDEEVLHDKEVILTFDDGPSRKYTEAILNALDAQCTKATFFVIGHLAITEKNILKDIDARGHTIASHTWSHKRLDKIGSKKAKDEFELGFSAVQNALGKPVAPLFRFPYLAESSEMRTYLSSRNVANVRINIDSRDFLTRNPSVVRKNVMSQLKKEGKGIILFHDIHASTASSIRTILKDLKDSNYKIVHLTAKEPARTVAKYNVIIEKQSAKAGGGDSDAIPLSEPDTRPEIKEDVSKDQSGASAEMAAKLKQKKRDWDQEPFLTRKPLRKMDDDAWAVSPLKIP